MSLLKRRLDNTMLNKPECMDVIFYELVVALIRSALMIVEAD
jgi:hypothetical protein